MPLPASLAPGRRLAALGVLVASLGAASCISQDPVDPDLPNLRLLSGDYVIRRVNGDSLPVPVTTATVSGTVIGGSLAIEPNSLEYRGMLDYRTPGGTIARINLRGSIAAHGPRSYDSVYFETVNYDRVTVASVRTSPAGMTVEPLNLLGLRIEFFRSGPARPPRVRS